MAENMDAVLEFLREKGFSKAEAALTSEIADKRKDLDDDLYAWSFNPAYDSASSSSCERKEEEEKDVRVLNESEGFTGFDALPRLRLPHVSAKAEGEVEESFWEEEVSNEDGYFMGSVLDVPAGREIHSSGGKKTCGSSRLSVSQRIIEDTSDLNSGLALYDYPNEYWDSDEYDDDDDVGYTRLPIEYETWFLAHEINYPTDSENGIGKQHGATPKDEEGKHESLVYEISKEDTDYFQDQDVGVISTTASQNDKSKSYETPVIGQEMKIEPESGKYSMVRDSVANPQIGSRNACNFSFSPSLRTTDREGAESGRSLWSNNDNIVVGDDINDCSNGICTDDVLAEWRQKHSDSSPVKRSRNGSSAIANRSGHSSFSAITNNCHSKSDTSKSDQNFKANYVREVDTDAILEDGEVAALQEHIRQINAQDEEFETFNLKIVHRKNSTGFEEDKNFHIVPNSVIAGRYHVTEYLGSAAFSKAIQAHDLQTGMDVCIKIIKNNKDFFDQSLDEIKLLKFVNKNDPADKHHILRLYEYFYFREHLLIVCELLKANLYEFHKFNRESGGEVYFTMPRLQSITIQCLEALQFLHGLGLIHCDLKPENILVQSYSQCKVKVIDLGSSCFETDNLCSYVQSRSYRAPEVILGLPYDKRIDIWSLGCILAELCTGNVLFQNDSSATLLARIIGIVGSIDQDMLSKGRDTHKYFSKNYTLYERNQETNKLEFLLPKKTSLRHRLRMGDQGFIDFIAHLLEINPMKRLSASEALKHPWLFYPYEPISS